jgi:hypothetical protein
MSACPGYEMHGIKYYGQDIKWNARFAKALSARCSNGRLGKPLHRSARLGSRFSLAQKIALETLTRRCLEKFRCAHQGALLQRRRRK